MKKSLALSALLVFSLTVKADWSNMAKQHLESYNSGWSVLSLGNTCQSIVDASWEMTIDFKEKKESFTEIEVPLKQRVFHKVREAKVKKGYQDYLEVLASKNSTKAETVFIFPGVFQSFDKDIPLTIGSELLKKGYNVVIFNSPISPAYLKRFSKFNAGDYVNEAEVFKNVIEEYKKTYPQLTTVSHAVGISYGALMASKIMDTNPDLLNGDLTLLGPQAEMAEGVVAFDRLINNYQYEQGLCNQVVGQSFLKHLQNFTINIIKRYAYLKIRSSYQKLEKYKEAGSIESLDKAVEILGSYLWKEDLIENLADQPDEIQNFLNSFRFFDTVTNYTTETLIQYSTDQASAALHAQNIVNRKQNNVRILMSSDDFISTPESWTNLGYSNLIENHTLVRKDGSHLGFAAEDWFKELIQIAF